MIDMDWVIAEVGRALDDHMAALARIEALLQRVVDAVETDETV